MTARGEPERPRRRVESDGECDSQLRAWEAAQTGNFNDSVPVRAAQRVELPMSGAESRSDQQSILRSPAQFSVQNSQQLPFKRACLRSRIDSVRLSLSHSPHHHPDPAPSPSPTLLSYPHLSHHTTPFLRISLLPVLRISPPLALHPHEPTQLQPKPSRHRRAQLSCLSPSIINCRLPADYSRILQLREPLAIDISRPSCFISNLTTDSPTTTYESAPTISLLPTQRISYYIDTVLRLKVSAFL